METIVLFDGESRQEYLEEQILLTVIKLLELHFSTEELVHALSHRIMILKKNE